jgi:hypothetical protein
LFFKKNLNNVVVVFPAWTGGRVVFQYFSPPDRRAGLVHKRFVDGLLLEIFNFFNLGEVGLGAVLGAEGVVNIPMPKCIWERAEELTQVKNLGDS